MNLVSNLNFLGTMSIFASATFAVSGIGVKLGKFTSSPHPLGFKYISGSAYKKKLYKATFELNKEHLTKEPLLIQNADELEKWCGSWERSTKKIKTVARYCQIKNIVWHRLIEDGVDLKDPETTPTNGCTKARLGYYADNKEDHAYLVGKKYCKKEATANSGSK